MDKRHRRDCVRKGRGCAGRRWCDCLAQACKQEMRGCVKERLRESNAWLRRRGAG